MVSPRPETAGGGRRAIPPDLAPAAIQRGLRSRRIGRALEVLAEVGSTNDLAAAAGRRGEPEGLVVIADHQTAGRGRRGRRWASPPGVGLYASVLLRPAVPPSRAPVLSLVAGLAVADAIREVAGLAPQLKWPNDVELGGRKVAGILPELAAEGSELGHVVVGIGLNVNQRAADFPAEVRGRATSLLLQGGQAYHRGLAACALLNALDRWYEAFCAASVPAILEACRRRSSTLGRAVEVIGEAGSWRGEALDLDPEGALLVRDRAGAVRRVVAGEVSVREAPEATRDLRPPD